MNVLIACYCPEHRDYLAKVVPWIRSKGHKVALKKGNKSYSWVLGENFDAVVLWNGAATQHAKAVALLRSQHKNRILFAEVSWFPGASLSGSGRTMYFDRRGINALSEIRRFEPPPCDKIMLEDLRNFVAVLTHSKKKPRVVAGFKAGTYTFVPLQLAKDTNITGNSPWFRDMQGLVRYVEKFVPGPVVFKRHPRDKGKYLAGRRDSKIVTGGDLHDYVAGARAVVGINSTVLLESLLLGKTVAALGVGLFTGRRVVMECHKDPTALGDLYVWEPPKREHREAFLYELAFRRQIDLTRPEQSCARNRVLTEVFAGGRQAGR